MDTDALEGSPYRLLYAMSDMDLVAKLNEYGHEVSKKDDPTHSLLTMAACFSGELYNAREAAVDHAEEISRLREMVYDLEERIRIQEIQNAL